MIEAVGIAALALGGLGLLAAVGLGVAAKVFYVEVDPIVEQVEEALPGANCGGCGHAGCAAAAVAIATGKMPPNGCVASSEEVHAVIAAITGAEVTAEEPKVARVGCRYPLEKADRRFNYAGANDCRAAFLVSGGPKECRIGCLGLASCIDACPFDALYMGENGLPVVDEVACTGCGTCVKTCPVGIMRLTSMTNRILGEQPPTECTAPCQRRCPAGIDMPEQIRQTKLGNYEQALRTIMERNPLPLICGRICPNPCETECRRNLTDQPVAINNLKRFVADYERKKGRRPAHYKAPATDRKVAVIGGGVEGLSAAYFLARLGHSPTIYEAAPKLGGLLRTAIPESRLPRDVLDWEIDNILAAGVRAETKRTFGEDVTVTSLFDGGAEAILLAVGGWDAILRRAETPAPALGGLYLLLPLGLKWARGEKVPVASKVAIVGGGKDALSVARRALGEGAEAVSLLFPSSKGETGLGDDELAEAEGTGITARFGARVTALLGEGEELSGVAIETSDGEEIIEAETIIAAAGRVPDVVLFPRDGEGEAPWRAERPSRPEGVGGDRGLFAEVEPVSDHRAAVEAIGAGRRAAATIHRHLRGESAPDLGLTLLPPPRNEVAELHDLRPVPERVRQKMASPDERRDPTREVASGLTEEAALSESERCLECGLICYERSRYS